MFCIYIKLALPLPKYKYLLVYKHIRYKNETIRHKIDASG